MPITLKELWKYPLAGAAGYETKELIWTEKSLGGNSVFVLMTEAEIAQYLESDGEYIPLRMTQAKYPELVTLETFESSS